MVPNTRLYGRTKTMTTKDEDLKKLPGEEYSKEADVGLDGPDIDFELDELDIKEIPDDLSLAFDKTVPLAYSMWTHGSSVKEQNPQDLNWIRKTGPYALYEGKPDTDAWFHFSIPTPVIVSNKQLRLHSVILQFLAHPNVWVNNVHIYDGARKIKTYDGLGMTGQRWVERFDVLSNYVSAGIGVSVCVRFGPHQTMKQYKHYIRFISAGANFIE